MKKIQKDQCCACMGCMNVCPEAAISPSEDSCGFLYPNIDTQKCTNCGLCISVCDFRKKKVNESTIIEAYAFQHNSADILVKSTSGGAFTAISDFILEHGGAVVGAVMEEDFTVNHVIAYSKVERDRMRGSKYVQSGTGFIFKQIEALLNNDKHVLFVGTPCQCAGLKAYLRQFYEKLIIVDFLCHGTPNNQFFKEHIRFIEKIERKKATNYIFRDKKFGWANQGIEGIQFTSGRYKHNKITQAYWTFFIDNVSLRPSCYNCKYRSLHRYSDVTIADFWGVEKITGKTDRKGTSLILVNSDKGIRIISEIKGKASSLVQVPIEKITYRIALKPPISKFDTDEFWKLYHTGGYSTLVNKYIDNSLKSNVRFILRKIKRMILK
jgi:coenzyme F420-reducing hydrogenase beta subunit